jgi:nitrous oxidase accessory protein NosD
MIQGGKLGYGLSEERLMRRIVIEDNVITDPAGAGIYVGSGQNVRISGNRISARSTSKPLRKTGAIVLENCSDVILDNNRVTDRRPETTSAVEIRSSVDAGSAGVTITRLIAKLSPTSRSVDDLRDGGK